MSTSTAFPIELTAAATALLECCKARGLRMVTAESCTGGLLAAVLTEISGSSAVVDRGYVTYSNIAKIECLGVPATLLENHGAVSREVAEAMATGALARARVDLAAAITGIAGPTGGTPQKPVGLVHIALHRKGHLTRHRECRFGDIGRTAIRLATVAEALAMLQKCAEH